MLPYSPQKIKWNYINFPESMCRVYRKGNKSQAVTDQFPPPPRPTTPPPPSNSPTDQLIFSSMGFFQDNCSKIKGLAPPNYLHLSCGKPCIRHWVNNVFYFFKYISFFLISGYGEKAPCPLLSTEWNKQELSTVEPSNHSHYAAFVL